MELLEGTKQGESKQILKDNLTPLEVEAPAAAAVEESQEEAEAAPSVAAALSDTADAMWKDAGDVF